MILIRNGTIHDGKGNILEDTDILIENGIIKRIAKSIEVSNDTEVFDAKDKKVFPGFIDSLNVWGAKGPGWTDDDLSETSDPITPQMDVVYAFDQDNMLFQRVFEYGVTSAGIAPSTSNVLGGYAAVFKTYGDHPYKMLVKDQVGMVSSITAATKNAYGSRNLCPMTKMGAIALLKDALMKAMKYKEDHKEYDAKSDALQKIINKEVPLLINCNTKSEMESLEFALKDFPIDIVLTGSYGINENIGKILDREIKVILGDLTNNMSSVNRRIDFEGIHRLIKNNLDIAISSCGDHVSSGKESLLWNAILCYKNGIDDKEVLKMITSIPAKILGVDDRIGSIEEGKDADIVIWSNNPITRYDAKIEAAFIDGRDILYARRDHTCWS